MSDALTADDLIKLIVAGRVGEREIFARVESIVLIRIEIDGNASQHGIARRAAVCVLVADDRSFNGACCLPVEEVDARGTSSFNVNERSAPCRVLNDKEWRRHLNHSISARSKLPEPIATEFISDR